MVCKWCGASRRAPAVDINDARRPRTVSLSQPSVSLEYTRSCVRAAAAMISKLLNCCPAEHVALCDTYDTCWLLAGRLRLILTKETPLPRRDVYRRPRSPRDYPISKSSSLTITQFSFSNCPHLRHVCLASSHLSAHFSLSPSRFSLVSRAKMRSNVIPRDYTRAGYLRLA